MRRSRVLEHREVRGVLPAVACCAAAIAMCGAVSAATAAPPGVIPAPPGDNPGGRGWEKVTPADKGGVDVGGLTYEAKARASSDGGALTFVSLAAFGRSVGSAFPSRYTARRGADGWSVEPSLPPSRSTAVQWLGAGLGRTANTLFVDDTLKTQIVETPARIAPGTSDGVPSIYAAEGQGWRLLTPGGPSLGIALANANINSAPTFGTATPDGQHVLFSSAWRFDDDPGDQNPGDLTRLTSGEMLFAASGGTIRAVGVRPDGTIAPVAQAGSGGVSTDNAISDNGRRIYFTETFGLGTAGPLNLYDQTTGTSVEISPSDAVFYTATADGRRALYSQYSAGTLHLFDAETGTSQEISVDHEPADVGEPQVKTVLAVSEDLSRIYFTAAGDLIAGQRPTGIDASGIYLWHDGDLELVAILADDRDGDVGPGAFPFVGIPDVNRWVNQEFLGWNPDASVMAFNTTARVTDYDPRGTRQVYRYDDATGDLVCISCPAGPPTADAQLRRKFLLLGSHARPLGARNSVSADGKRVFFETGEALVPEDTNGALDVYVWEAGNAHLVSDGESPTGSGFVAASASGADVFFATAAPLVGTDRDELVDIYDARIGGGSPEMQPPGPGCDGDECQGLVTPPPVFKQPATDGPGGPGDPTPLADPSFTVTKLTRRQIARLARGKRVVVTARATEDGRLFIAATARVGRAQRQVVAHASTVVQAHGTGRLAIRLSRSGRAALQRQGRLRVRLVTTFDAVLDPKVSTVTLRSASIERRGSKRRERTGETR